MAQHGTIDSPRIREDSRPVHARGRMFVIGDSFSSIRRTDPTNNVNGRLTASSGMILWDWFRIGFNPVLDMDLTTNYAREGAFATRDVPNPPAWAASTPIPSVATQWTNLKTQNPSKTITRHDVFGILIGTNDGSAWDGGATGSPTQVRDVVRPILEEAIVWGFRRILLVVPEAKYQPGLWDLYTPVVAAIRSANPTIVLARCAVDAATREYSLSDAYLDGTHPKDEVHRRLGEIMSSTFWNYDIVDHTQSFFISNRLSAGAVKAIGFSNFDTSAGATGSASRFELIGASTSFEIKANQRPRLRGFNGIDVFGAWEGVEPTSPAGGGKNDPCLRVVGGGLTHDSVLRLETQAGGTADQAPLLFAYQGTTERLRLKAGGEMWLTAGAQFPFVVRSKGIGIARVVVDSDFGGNCGFSFRSSDVDTWAVAGYNTGAGKHSLAFFNYGHPGPLLSFGIHGTTNRATFGAFQWNEIDTPVARLEIQDWTGDAGAAYLRCVAAGTKTVRFEVQSGGMVNTLQGYQVGSNQVIGGRQLGWGQTNAGGSRAAISTGSTSAQIAAALIQLITDLKTHGLLGG